MKKKIVILLHVRISCLIKCVTLPFLVIICAISEWKQFLDQMFFRVSDNLKYDRPYTLL